MPSSPITVPVPSPESLLACLGRVPDPRDPRGVRYPLVGLLAVAVTAVVAGARSFAAIGEWAGALGAASLADLGLAQAPQESNLRKLFARLDTVALDLQLAVHAWTRTRTVRGRRPTGSTRWSRCGPRRQPSCATSTRTWRSASRRCSSRSPNSSPRATCWVDPPWTRRSPRTAYGPPHTSCRAGTSSSWRVWARAEPGPLVRALCHECSSPVCGMISLQRGSHRPG
jgi:hypothetical protein